jgi:hypothetical protein
MNHGEVRSGRWREALITRTLAPSPVALRATSSPREAGRGLKWVGGVMMSLALVFTACSAGRMEVIGVTPRSLELGLVAHWPCDSEGGSALVDTSGNRHDGNLAGASWVAGRFGGALHFEAGGGVVVPGFPQATRSMSVSLWYQAPASPGSGEEQSLISTLAPSAGGWAMTAGLGAATTLFRFAYPTASDAGANSDLALTTVPAAETWIHLVAVVDDAAMRLSIYRNGELAASTAIGGLIETGGPDLYLGRWAGDGRLLLGDLDDVAIWSRALVPAEILELYAAPAPDVR